MPEPTGTAENEVLAAYSRACNEMDRLTSAPGGPSRSWRWSIPANPERDSDLIFADALKHIPALAAALGRVRALLAANDSTPTLSPYGVGYDVAMRQVREVIDGEGGA